MYLYIVVLRLIHIFSGVFWAGATFFFVSLLEPVSKAAGPEGAKFMQKLGQSRFPVIMSLMGVLNPLSGLLLYWQDSGGLQAAWITSGPGLGFTFGGAMGLAAAFIALFVARPASTRMGALAMEIQKGGGPPSPAQMAEIQSLQVRLSKGAFWTAVFLALALIGMSAAEYIAF